jgi:hypothetical protein
MQLLSSPKRSRPGVFGDPLASTLAIPWLQDAGDVFFCQVLRKCRAVNSKAGN